MPSSMPLIAPLAAPPNPPLPLICAVEAESAARSSADVGFETSAAQHAVIRDVLRGRSNDCIGSSAIWNRTSIHRRRDPACPMTCSICRGAIGQKDALRLFKQAYTSLTSASPEPSRLGDDPDVAPPAAKFPPPSLVEPPSPKPTPNSDVELRRRGRIKRKPVAAAPITGARQWHASSGAGAVPVVPRLRSRSEYESARSRGDQASLCHGWRFADLGSAIEAWILFASNLPKRPPHASLKPGRPGGP